MTTVSVVLETDSVHAVRRHLDHRLPRGAGAPGLPARADRRDRGGRRQGPGPRGSRASALSFGHHPRVPGRDQVRAEEPRDEGGTRGHHRPARRGLRGGLRLDLDHRARAPRGPARGGGRPGRDRAEPGTPLPRGHRAPLRHAERPPGSHGGASGHGQRGVPARRDAPLRVRASFVRHRRGQPAAPSTETGGLSNGPVRAHAHGPQLSRGAARERAVVLPPRVGRGLLHGEDPSDRARRPRQRPRPRRRAGLADSGARKARARCRPGMAAPAPRGRPIPPHPPAARRIRDDALPRRPRRPSQAPPPRVS